MQSMHYYTYQQLLHHTHTSPTLELYNFPSLQFSLKSFEYYNNESFKGDITLSDTPKRTIIQLHKQKFKTIIDNHVIKFVAQVDKEIATHSLPLSL